MRFTLTKARARIKAGPRPLDSAELVRLNGSGECAPPEDRRSRSAWREALVAAFWLALVGLGLAAAIAVIAMFPSRFAVLSP